MCTSYLNWIDRHENSKAAQMSTRAHSVCGIGVMSITTICGPGPSLSPVRTEVAHLSRLLSVLCTKQNHHIKSRLCVSFKSSYSSNKDHTDRWDYLQVSEGDVDVAAQVLSGGVGDHNRHDCRGDHHSRGIHTIFFKSCELVK